MAHSQEQWDKAKFLFELGTPLSDIQEETGISKGQISKRSKRDGWEKETEKKHLKSEIVEFEREKETLEAKKETIVSKLCRLEDFEITLMDKIVEKEVEHKSLVFSTQSLALVRNNQILTKNKKTVLLKGSEYADGKRIGDTYEPYEVPLSPSDIKETIDSTHKAGQSLGVIEQFAPKTTIENTNAQQTNIDEKRVVIARRSDRA